MGVTGFVEYCPSGQQLEDDNCVDCAQAYYKDNKHDPHEKFAMCRRCPKSKITTSTNSTSVKDCNIGMIFFKDDHDARTPKAWQSVR